MARVQAGRGDLLQDRLAGGDHGTAAVVADGPGGCRLAACRLAVPDPCKTPPGVGIAHGNPGEGALTMPTPSQSGPAKGKPPHTLSPAPSGCAARGCIDVQSS